MQIRKHISEITVVVVLIVIYGRKRMIKKKGDGKKDGYNIALLLVVVERGRKV